MKTLIAVPCMDQVPAQFAQSLVMLNKVDQCVVAFNIGSLVYKSRNKLASLAVQVGADRVLWFDSDMIFTPDTLERLIASKEKTGADIVSGLYFRRTAPFTPVIFDKLEIDDTGCHWSELKQIPSEPFPIGGCGFGCVLMSTEIFVDVTAKYKDIFGPIRGVGEDLSFCWRARQLGYKIVCDPAITLGHVGTTVINREFYDAYNKTKA